MAMCEICKTVELEPNKGGRGRRRKYCPTCAAHQNRVRALQHYHTYRDECRERIKKWKSENPEKLAAYRSERQLRRLEGTAEKTPESTSEAGVVYENPSGAA